MYVCVCVLQVEFRSDTGERFRGFRLDVVCSPTESSLVNRVMKRRRRDVEEGGEESGETARVQMGAESRHRTLRTTKCTVGYRMTETNCTEVIDFSQAPPTPVSSAVQGAVRGQYRSEGKAVRGFRLQSVEMKGFHSVQSSGS